MSPVGAPVVIIGAPRSGTNALRDALTSHAGLTTWPCDEINYIWRVGNAGFPTDELRADHARPEVRRYIRQVFERLRERSDGAQVVEKTCANCLRVGFVERILPEARYLFLVRDGRDAAASAAQRWTASPGLAYSLRKLRFIPVNDLPRYALEHLGLRLRQLFDPDRRLPSWGPRFDGLDELVRSESIVAVAAHQWVHCTRAARRALRAMDPDRWLPVRYERLVQEPVAEMRRIMTFAGLPTPDDVVERVASGLRDTSVGKWKRVLSESEQVSLEEILGEELAQWGYV